MACLDWTPVVCTLVVNLNPISLVLQKESSVLWSTGYGQNVSLPKKDPESLAWIVPAAF